MNKLKGILLATIIVIALPLGDVYGRGFGGFRGGGGGFGGGFGGDRFGGGGFDADRFGGGGFGGDRFGGGDRSYGSDESSRGGYHPGGYSGSSYDRGGSRGQAYRPDEGSRVSEDSWRNRGSSEGNRDGEGNRPNRTDLNKFLGMPTDAGLSHIDTPLGRVDGGFEASRVTAGRVEGPHGGSAAFVSGTHIGYVPPEIRTSQAWTVRNSNYGHNLFTPAWYKNHPDAWADARLRAAAWTPATWFGVTDWLDCDSMPDDYEYGSTVVYQGDTVYVEGQPIGSPADYYNQASTLAVSGDAKQDDQSQWMPLGVFAMVQGTQTDPSMTFQLAVSKQGVIRGTCFNTLTNTSLPVQGAVDRKTQRVAWTVGDNKGTVYDTGLYNLTKDQAPALVHFGKDKTQQWLMIRLTGQDQTGSDS
jgi:hypothetical protein